MSNGEDVLDTWEEIDEARLNTSVQKLKNSLASSSTTSTCERLTENCYLNSTSILSSSAINSFPTNTSLSGPTQMKLLQRSRTQDSTTSSTSIPSAKSPLDDMSSTFQPVMMVLHKPQDEYQSANYTAPIANQTVKILRRPTQSTEPRNNGLRLKQPLKTLKQREQEYAEARLRILGSAKNPEDEQNLTATTTLITTSTTNSTPSTPTVTVAALSNNFVATTVATTKTNSPKLQVGANQYKNYYNQQSQQQYQQNFQSQPQQQQQTYFYNQQQQQPQPPAYNNNRTYNMNPLLTLGPMGAIGQPAQYQAITLSSPQTQQHQQQQQHLKYQQYHQMSPQQQHEMQQQQQTWSPVVGGSVSSSSARQQQQQQQQSDTILRLPRGPDGTTGFQTRR